MKILLEERAQGAIEYILLLSCIVFVSVGTLFIYLNMIAEAGKRIESSVSQATGTTVWEQAILDIEETVVEIPGNEVDEDDDGIALCNPKDSWRNHGEFVSCVAHSVNELVDSGYLTEEEGGAIVAKAAQSDVGKPRCWWYRFRRWWRIKL